MINMIDEPFHGNLDLSMVELKRGSAYYKKRHEILTLMESLEETEHEKTAVQLSDALNDLDYIISRAYFTIGFRWGARMALDMLNDKHDTFSPVI